jgi:plasmid stabilization system protein ParE
VQIRRAAEFDLAAAQMWYETQVIGLGTQFHFQVSQVLARLAVTPLIYPMVYRDVRRAVVHRFPYLIWYRVLDKDVMVLACTHGRQDPDIAISHLTSS